MGKTQSTSLINQLGTMYRTIFISLFVVFIIIPNHAQSVHSNLQKQQELRRFSKMSQQMMCQCGCNLLLSQCNHQRGMCMAWSMRSVIDGLIQQNVPNDKIINGFVHGFHKTVYHNKAFSQLHSELYQSLLPKYEQGFGEIIHSTPQNDISYILIGIFSVTVFSVAGSYLLRRKSTLLGEEDETHYP